MICCKNIVDVAFFFNSSPNFSNSVVEIQQKYEREKEKVEEIKFWISVITLLKFLLSKSTDQKPIEAMSLSK